MLKFIPEQDGIAIELGGRYMRLRGEMDDKAVAHALEMFTNHFTGSQDAAITQAVMLADLSRELETALIKQPEAPVDD